MTTTAIADERPIMVMSDGRILELVDGPSGSPIWVRAQWQLDREREEAEHRRRHTPIDWNRPNYGVWGSDKPRALPRSMSDPRDPVEHNDGFASWTPTMSIVLELRGTSDDDE